MNIFIDDQYKHIYGGEFKNLVENSIIKPLKTIHNVVISKDKDDCKNILSHSNFDIVICTGYSAEILTWISDTKNTKLISIVYEMNAEKFYTILNSDSYVFQKISIEKSKIIFLSNAILTFSKMVKDEIDEIYSKFSDITNTNKVYVINSILDKTQIEKYEKPLFEKYVVMPLSINGLTDSIIIPPLIDSLDKNIDLKIVCPILTTPIKNLYENISEKGLKNKIIFITDLNDIEYHSLFKNAIASFFMSEYDMDIENIVRSFESNCITLLNNNNEFYHEFFKDNISYYNPDENINEAILAFNKISKEDKQIIIDIQNKALETCLNENSNINDIIKKIMLA